MDYLGQAWQFAVANWSGADGVNNVSMALFQHVEYVLLSLSIAVVICVPLGILAARSRVASFLTINIFGTIRAIPSIAVLFLALPVLGPYLGYDFGPALIALTILACPPILVNTSAGFRGIDPAVVEAARGMGMSPMQVLWKVETPLALPVVLAGVRTSTLEVIASATLAIFIGGGGLGLFIEEGLPNQDIARLLVGAVPIAVLALFAEVMFSIAQRFFSPAIA